VTSARHKQVVDHATRRRLLRLALPAAAATLVTGSVVGVAVGAGSHDAAPTAAAPAATTQTPQEKAESSQYLAARVGTVSRSAKRVTLHKKPAVKDREYMTAPLNLWAAPSDEGKPLDVLEEGKTVALTGVVKAGFAQILHEGQLRWVNDDYLSDDKPEPEPEPEAASEGGTTTSVAGVSTAACPDGSGTESGLTSSAVRLYRAVCNAFPALSSYGGYDGHGEHSSGRAIDFMVSDSSLGQAVADWCRAHAGELGLSDIIWSQRIWTAQRSGEGWRSMEDRGSATANHYDHVHVQVS
jgi:hypothetical protein